MVPVAEVKLRVEKRDQAGKGVARRARARGQVPAIVYGRGMEPMSIAVDRRDLVNALHTDAGMNVLLDIEVDGETTTRPCQAVVAALGFIADLGPLQQWGLEVSKRHIVVDAAMRTNLARVFAAGDITEYPGKVRLIAVGFGEAATAVNNATVAIDPTAKVFPGHSSEGT